MGNATFRPLDETSFDDERSLSTAHAKRLSENIHYATEERWYTASCVWPQHGEDTAQDNYSALKCPTFAAADWRCIGPFPVYCAEPTSNAKMWITFDVSDHAVEVYASTPRHIFDDENAVSCGTGDTSAEIPVSRLNAGVNLVWIVIKSGAGSSTSQTGVNVDVVQLGELGATALGVDGAGFRYVEDVVITGAVTFRSPNRTELIAFTNGLEVARNLAYPISRFVNSTTAAATLDYGTLGSIEIKSVHLEFSNTRSLGQEWPWWRWYQFPSAMRGAALASETVRAHKRRMPALSWGAEPHSRVATSAGWEQQPGLYLAGSDFDASYSEVWRSRVYMAQDSRDGRTDRISVIFAIRFPGLVDANSYVDVDVDFRATADDGSSSESASVSVTGVSESQEQYLRSPSASEIDRRILASIESNQTDDERVVSEALTRDPNSLDRNVWTVVSIAIDVGSLTQGHWVVTLEAQGDCGPWVMSPALVQAID